MRNLPVLALVLLATGLGAGPLAAQTADPGTTAPDTGASDAGSTGSVNRSITASGQTKPPGRAAAPQDPTQQPDRVKEINRKVDTGICIGCD
ncbi:hypothetical protein [Methylobacterium sp. JK268]